MTAPSDPIVGARVAGSTERSAPAQEPSVAGNAEYLAGGVRRAQEIGNRGPLRYGPDGRLHSDVLSAYWEHGFYVLTDGVDASEIAELRADVAEVLDRAPVGNGAELDKHGRPALGHDFARTPYAFTRPLADPTGGAGMFASRATVQMDQPSPDDRAPAEVVFLLSGICQTMPSALRLYGHPDLLTIAESVNGGDFVPCNDYAWVKQPGLGCSIAWHQEGVIHWDSPDWDMGIHGVNIGVQLYETTAANALWVVPGTHKAGRVDLPAKLARNGGSPRLPDAVPLLCQPGDVIMLNRQTVHGSFANTSPDLRVTVTFGFHRRASVLGATVKLGARARTEPLTYDEQRVFRRSSVIAVAIDARAQHRPGERRYAYAPFAGLEDDFRFTHNTFDSVIRDYSLNDLPI